MRTTIPITPDFIKTAALREGANRDEAFFDTAVNGFYLRVYPSGKKTFGVKWFVRGQQRRTSLGHASPSTLDKARAKAVQIINAARQDHVDLPAVEKRKANRHTIGKLAPDFIDDLRKGRYQAKNKKPRDRTIAEIDRYLVGTFREDGSIRTTAAWKPLHRRYPEDVHRRDILQTLDTIADENGPVASDRALSALSTFYGWLLYRGHVENTPLGGIKKRASGRKRERVLSAAELRFVWLVCEALEADAVAKAGTDGRSEGRHNYSRIVRLLILTGQREGEIGGLHRDEVNTDARQIELPGHRTKNGKPHIIPLSGLAWDIVSEALCKTSDEHPYLFGRWGNAPFGGWDGGKEELDGCITKVRGGKALPHWVVHDLRHTFITQIVEQRVCTDEALVELIVNHISGRRAGVAGVYQKAKRLEERREALERWAQWMAGLVEGEERQAA